MKELTLQVEKKVSKDGKEFNSFYVVINGQLLYFKPVNWALANYIFNTQQGK